MNSGLTLRGKEMTFIQFVFLMIVVFLIVPFVLGQVLTKNPRKDRSYGPWCSNYEIGNYHDELAGIMSFQIFLLLVAISAVTVVVLGVLSSLRGDGGLL